MNIDEIINGVNLKQIADAIVDTDRMDDINHLPSNSVIWCKTEFIDMVFDTLRTSNNVYKLITHCSDHSITEDVFRRKPPCILKWYAQNVDFLHDDLIPLPIGLENHIGPHKGNSIDIKYVDIMHPARVVKKNVDMIYCNFNLHTYNNRPNVSQIIKNKNIGFFDSPKPFSEYCESMKNFLFVASPRGNGIDCHRTWEALYLGSIPIVEKHFMYDSYKTLPIIQIENWNNISIKNLLEKCENFKYNPLQFTREELKLNFWKNEIKFGTL